MSASAENEKIFVTLITANQALIRKVCRIYALSADDRNDLFQEIVIQLWKAFPGFREESKFSTWMYRVALNTAISYRRREQRRRFADVELPDNGFNGHSEHKEQLQLLYEVIAGLEKMERALIFLHLEGYRYAEIAEISGLSESNVSTKISRIKKHLVKEMEKINAV